MSSEWEENKYYNVGDVVVYEGYKYKNIQSHRSQADWTPDVTPALWGRLSRGEAEAHDSGAYHSNEVHRDDDGKKWDEVTETKVQVTQDEKKKEWWDLDAHRKKEVEIGGGLALGAALLGAGVFAYEHHKKSQEQQKAEAWALGNWISEARARTQRYRTEGATETVTWVLVESKEEIPQDAIIGGQDNGGESFFVARSYQAGGLHPGKAGAHLSKGGVISYGGKAIDVEKFEVAVAVTDTVTWVDGTRPFSVQQVSSTLVEGGKESDGTVLYIAQAPYQGALHPGKVRETYKGAYIAVDREEKVVEEYRVLVLA